MPVKITRPAMYLNQRLFHRTTYDLQRGRVGGHYRGPQFIPSGEDKGLFRLLDPDNVIAQLRLYKWFYREFERRDEAKADFSGMVRKDDLMHQCFQDYPSVSKVRVGRLLRMIVQYETNFQQNPGKHTNGQTVMNWRWCHSLEIVYGLEYLMALWLPDAIEADNGSCSNEEEFNEELEIIRTQSKEEDRDLVAAILRNKLY